MARRKDGKQSEPTTEISGAQTPASRELSIVPVPEPIRSRSHRFALLAASVGLAAACGGVIGSFGMNAAARLVPAAIAKTATGDETHALQNSIALLTAELSALRTGLETSSQSAIDQFGKLTERLDRAERAQSEQAAKLAKLLENFDRRTAAAPDTTGSIPSPTAPVEKASAESKDTAKPAIVQGWIVRDVYRGRIALLENRYGLYEVEPGSNVPGVGRVESIKRQDGHWVIVTPKGLITSYR